MERSYLQWNLINWITVVLMASIGIMAVAALTSGVRSYRDKAA